MLKYGIIGLGGLGKVHLSNILKIEKERKDIELCAIANRNFDDIKKATVTNIGTFSVADVDFSKYHLYTDYSELIENEKLDFVICALPSFLHYDAVTKALKAGMHVFCEKPMALKRQHCIEMEKVANACNKKLMIGQISRFSAEYIKCREIIESGKYGKVLRADFFTKSPLPKWSAGNWLLDVNKSGGCVIDMHVHDVDMINFLFGTPKSLVSHATHYFCEFESIHTVFEYEDKVITATADWGLPAKFEFDYGFTVAFEKACIEFKNQELKISTDDELQKTSYPEDTTDFYGEILEFVECVAENKDLNRISLESVSKSMDMVFAEVKSAETGERVYL